MSQRIKKPRHTPGNWVLTNWGQIVALHRDEYGAHETLIAEVNDGHEWFRANARLIRAAPRLLKALRLCERALEERDVEAEAYAAKNARAVLDWAQGGSP